MGNLPKAQSLKRLSHHHELWLGKQSLAGGSFSVLETSLEVILGSGPTAVPLPKSTCPDHRAQLGGGRGAGGLHFPPEGLRHILSTPIPPSCLPSWCPLFFHKHPWLESIITHSPRHVPEFPRKGGHVIT